MEGVTIYNMSVKFNIISRLRSGVGKIYTDYAPLQIVQTIFVKTLGLVQNKYIVDKHTTSKRSRNFEETKFVK